MNCSYDELKVKVVSLKGFSYCTLDGCKGDQGQRKERDVTYLKMEARFPQLDERIDHMENRSDIALIKVFEANYRSEPEIKSTIIGQMVKGDVVTVMNHHGEWVEIQCGTHTGWVDHGSLYFHKEIAQHQQLKGETHATYICECCIEEVDWRNLYRQEIEEKQIGHVISNYAFDYAEMALAMEEGAGLSDGLVDQKLLINRIQEEVASGYHGAAKRFNSTKVIEYLLRNRPAC